MHATGFRSRPSRRRSWFLPILGRLRMRKLLMSGDVEQVIGSWQGSVGAGPQASAMVPLFERRPTPHTGGPMPRAAPCTRKPGPGLGCGARAAPVRGGAARRVRGRSRDSDAQGRSSRGDAHVRRGAPCAPSRRISCAAAWPPLRARSPTGAAAATRALAKAADASPLVHWAMRYAAAIVAVDRGRAGDVRAPPVGRPRVARGKRLPHVPRRAPRARGTVQRSLTRGPCVGFPLRREGHTCREEWGRRRTPWRGSPSSPSTRSSRRSATAGWPRVYRARDRGSAARSR